PALLAVCIGIGRPIQLIMEDRVDTIGQGLIQALLEFWPSLLIAQVVALGLAWLCYRRQVRYAAEGAGRWLWPVYVFLFGLPGWVGYLTSRRWPTLERCPSCGA